MATGGYVHELDVGDRIGPVEYTMSAFVVREYSHANELHHDFLQGIDAPVAPPTLVHLDKLRLYRHGCPLGTGPDARIHYEYDATIHGEVRVGDRLSVSGVVTERYSRRGREYVVMEMELRRVADDALLISYRDTSILAFTPPAGAKT